MSWLAGRTVAITGAAGGVGRCLVRRCRDEGADVVALDVAPLDGAVAVDVTSPEEVARALAEPVDMLINNAGVMDRLGLVPETELAEWERLLAINLTGAFLCSRQVIPCMLAAGGGLIVNVASVAGMRGGRAGAAYTASKYGLVGLTLNIAATYGAQRIRANAVCPGPIDTDMAHDVDVLPSAAARRERDPERPQPLLADDVAAAALLFADVPHLNGVVMPVDDGWTAF
jgi:NAD(P)-dependent dehydrogenase (short-subunit alcohol dehydrogenase family)